jgi:restriction endonuclease S subunit
MRYSIVNYRELEQGTLRFDPEYYHPENLFLLKILEEKKHNRIGDFSFVTDGIHASIDFDENSKINLLSAKAPKENCFDLSGTSFISKIQDEKNKRTRLKKDDVIISTVGTIGNCAVVDESILPANADRHVGIVRIKNDLPPRFLSTFLLSKYGKFQTYRESTGNVQLNLFIYKIKEILVPKFSFNFQSKVENLCLKASNLRSNSKSLYSQAEQLLLSELGFLDWKPKHVLSFVRNYSKTEQAERIDAEYFQPKYDDIVKVIKNYQGGWDTLSNLCNLIGHPSNPPYAESNDKDKTFIVTQKHLGDYSLNDEFWKDEDALYTTNEFVKKNSQYILKQDDVLLYSVGAYIGKANIYKETTKATIGSFLTLLRTKQEKLNPYYLMVFLNTNIGVMLSKQHQRGMAQQYLYPYDIRTFPIPLLDKEIQTQIQRKITESFNLRKQSKHLLECAKQAVEMAIEKDEQTAMKWIQNESKVKTG